MKEYDPNPDLFLFNKRKGLIYGKGVLFHFFFLSFAKVLVV